MPMHSQHSQASNDAFQGVAPGRVNLIGEHVDYNGGYVLPTVIPQHAHVSISLRDDDLVVGHSNLADSGQLDYRLGHEQPRHDWFDYVRGTTWLLHRQGHRLHGFAVSIQSDVPVGSGLSSSAALTVALQRALRAAFSLRLDDLQVARNSQLVENDFVGARVGAMDPMACSLGRAGHALFLDCASGSHELIPLPPGAELVVIHSGLVHQHSSGGYNARRGECDQACALLGVATLRELGRADLTRSDLLPEPLNRRVRHVITENERVLAVVAALREQDWPRVGSLLLDGHRSLSQDYEVSLPAIDTLVDLASHDAAVIGARMTGGGFGGSVVVLAQPGQAATVARRVADQYAARTGNKPTIVIPA